MTTFRERLLADGIDYVPSDRSSLDAWFASVIDISFAEMEVKDVARSIRQDLFLNDMLPLAEVYLKEDPLAGYMYDGEVIAAIASLTSDRIKDVLPIIKRINLLLAALDRSSLDNTTVLDIEKLSKMS